MGKNLFTIIEEAYKPYEGKYVILFLDELDKILEKRSFSDQIQNSLLPIFGGDDQTKKFFIVATGAFSKILIPKNREGLTRAGFSTEFAGRINYVVPLEKLSAQAMMNMLELDKSPLKNCKSYISRHCNVNVVFEEAALTAIATACANSPFGARSLWYMFKIIEDEYMHGDVTDPQISETSVIRFISIFNGKPLEGHTFSSSDSSSSLSSLTEEL